MLRLYTKNHGAPMVQKVLKTYTPLMDRVSQLQNQMLQRSHIPTSSLIFVFFVIFHGNLGHIAPERVVVLFLDIPLTAQ